jgi:hypothetical protein
MMKRRLSSLAIRTTGLLMAALMIFTPALAQEQPSLAPLFTQWLENVRGGEPTGITVSAALHELSPYGEQTVNHMNSLLENIKASIQYLRGPDGETTQTQLLIGDTPALSFAERTEAAQSLAQASFLPGITLSAASGSPLSALLGEDQTVPSWVTDIPDLGALTGRITEALTGLAPFVQEKKVSFSIPSVGSAKKALVYTVPEESAQALKDALTLLAADLPLPGIGEMIGTMTLSGSATVTLYQSAQGENMGLAIKGTLGFQDITPRKVNFLWGFAATEKKAVQTVSLKSPAVKGSDAFTVTGKAEGKYGEAKNTLSLSLDIRNTLNKKTERTRWNGDLTCLIAQDNQRLEGKIEQRHTLTDGMDETLTVTPSLLAFLADESVSLKGSVRVKWVKEKNVQGDVSFSLQADKGAPPAFEKTAQTLSVDGMGEDQMKTLREQGELAAAQAIWQAAAALPPESLALVLQGITQSDWEEILGTIADQ